MDDIMTCYDRVLGRITNLLLPDGPLHGSAEAALKLDALDLRLRSWKYEFDQTTSGDFKEQHRDTFERLAKQVAQVFETLEPLLGLVEDCANRAPRTMISLLPLLEAETEKLNEVERELDDPIDVTLSTEPATQPQDSDDTDSDNESDFDLSWRPDDYDSPEFMNRLLHIHRSDLVFETLRAATLGHSETLESLLARPQWADLLSAVDDNGDTALQIAESKGHEDIVQKILRKQAATHGVERTATHVSSRPDPLTFDHVASRQDPPALDHVLSPDAPTSNHIVSQSADVDALRRIIEDAEDFACVLQNFRDDMPRAAQRDLVDITSAIGELYLLSTILQQLCNAFDAPQYADRLYRISSDAALVAKSAQLTLGVALGMVGRASPATHWMVWDDLSHRLQDIERAPFSTRLKWYYNLTEGLLDQLEGYPFDATLSRIRGSIHALLQQQQQQQQPGSTRTERSVISYRILDPPPNVPQPRVTLPASPRPPPPHPVSENRAISRSNAPPPVRRVPSPQKPSVTWSSTHTYVGTDHTQFKRDPNSSYDAAPCHWASKIFGDVRWHSRYRAGQQPEAMTRCKGDVQADAKLVLQEEGYDLLGSVHFSDNGSTVTFYWRPRDGRARLLFTSINNWGQEVHYCNPLTRLRAFRDGSILELCMASSSDDHNFWTWATLKFINHERMVLFYSTFVALKRQDPAGLPTVLIEDPCDMEEEALFSGTIRDREMFHVLRLLQDRGSGVLRLEARSCRGDKVEVPIWTAFLTKYRDNRDREFFNLESRGVVSMICPKPKPYIFVSEYGLPLMPDGTFALQFVKRDDAALLVEIWIGLCTSGKRP